MKNFALRLGGLLAAVATIAHAQPAAATVMRQLTLGEQMGLSDLAIRAKVVSARTFEGEGGLPFTDTEVEVLEALKGEIAAGERLHVRQLKGEVRGLHRAVPGDAELLPGEEVVLFLHGMEDGVAYLTALGQSKFIVDRPVGPPSPSDDWGAVVIRDLSGSAFYAPGGSPAIGRGAIEPPVALDRFLDTLRDLAREGR